MRTRSGSLYPKKSSMLSSEPKNLKRRRHPTTTTTSEKEEPMTTGFGFVVVADNNNCPFERYWKKAKVACKGLERGYFEDGDHLIRRNKKRSVGQMRSTGAGTGVAIDSASKRSRNRNRNASGADLFDQLPDDLVIVIMSRLSASASSPSDIVNARLACKRFYELGHHPWVLAKASTRSLSVQAKFWSDSAHRFLKMCADAGNMDACYILGMIYFYCLENRRSGAAYMAKAAMRSHPSALYSLAIIQFNGSGGSKSDKNLPAGVTLCARAAHLGHLDALRELGYCLQDGYGVRRDTDRGRRFLCQATAYELSALVSSHVSACRAVSGLINGSGKLDLGSGSLQVLDPHPVNRFLVEWLATRQGTTRERTREDGVRACSHVLCGRVETRRHEFRRCSVCGKANYCSRACQAMDWKRVHREECVPPQPEDAAAGQAGEDLVVMPDQGLVD